MDYQLEFEKPLIELENQIKELKHANSHGGIDISKEIKALEKKADGLLREIYQGLSSWERVQLSRHPNRPHANFYLENMLTEIHELHGDRCFRDDPSMLTGFGFLDGLKVCFISIEKGDKTADKVKRNFGMSFPDGYRKALRIMSLAAQFNIPIITLVDTPGAYPGTSAEERGQAMAIAENLMEMFGLRTPIISVVIGEGGSGGALGIAVADRVYMMEYSIYSVISPESCASILFSDPSQAKRAANALDLSPQKALEFGVINGIIKEPSGGAHRDPMLALSEVKNKIKEDLIQLKKEPLDQLVTKRYERFRKLGNQYIQGF